MMLNVSPLMDWPIASDRPSERLRNCQLLIMTEHKPSNISSLTIDPPAIRSLRNEFQHLVGLDLLTPSLLPSLRALLDQTPQSVQSLHSLILNRINQTTQIISLVVFAHAVQWAHFSRKVSRMIRASTRAILLVVTTFH